MARDYDAEAREMLALAHEPQIAFMDVEGVRLDVLCKVRACPAQERRDQGRDDRPMPKRGRKVTPAPEAASG